MRIVKEIFLDTIRDVDTIDQMTISLCKYQLYIMTATTVFIRTYLVKYKVEDN